MKNFLAFLVAATLALVVAGCRSGNSLGGPAAVPAMPGVAYGNSPPPGTAYIDPAATPPTAMTSSCGPSCTSCSNTLPTLSAAQNYVPLSGN